MHICDDIFTKTSKADALKKFDGMWDQANHAANPPIETSDLTGAPQCQSWYPRPTRSLVSGLDYLTTLALRRRRELRRTTKPPGVNDCSLATNGELRYKGVQQPSSASITAPVSAR